MDEGDAVNLCFIHGNFPGQFKDIAPSLAAKCGGRTIFLTLSENPQGIVLPNVELRQFKLHRDTTPDTHAYLQPAEAAVIRGQSVLRTLNQLFQEEDFVPDVVICHGGMGFGLYIKALMPDVRLISYMEWYFTAENSKALFENMTINDQMKLETRNTPLLQEMIQADDIVCPTQWQKSQFPPVFQDKIKVIFDGVDTDFFSPGQASEPLVLGANSETPLSLTSDQLILSYGTRGMEPLRGFPEFMRAAAAAQQVFPHLQVIVFGNDRTAYSYPSQHPTGSWKAQLLEELKNDLDLSRTHFTGLLTYGELVQLFRRSNLHCYFTRPYVISWGVFQATACGANLLVNNFKGIHEVFENIDILDLADLDCQRSLDQSVIAGLEKSSKRTIISSKLALNLDINTSLLKWFSLLNN